MHEKVIPTITDWHGESLSATTVGQEVKLVVAILVIVHFDSTQDSKVELLKKAVAIKSWESIFCHLLCEVTPLALYQYRRRQNYRRSKARNQWQTCNLSYMAKLLPHTVSDIPNQTL